MKLEQLLQANEVYDVYVEDSDGNGSAVHTFSIEEAYQKGVGILI